MDCPKCGLVNPFSATRCDCGYDFTLSSAQNQLSISCFQCKAEIAVTPELRGKKIKCPKCGAKQKLPSGHKSSGAGVPTLPYRWGTFVGVGNGIAAIFYIVAAIEGEAAAAEFGPTMPPWPLGLLLGAGLAITCAGVLRRRRFGVIAFVATYILHLVFSLVKLTNLSLPANVRGVFGSSIFIGVLSAAATLVYFAKRWRFMVK
jgi:DNA-directed RNA polymerase subunit RPC12/RpoP